MNRSIDRLKLIFLGVFVLASLGMLGYQAYYVWPRNNCEAAGSWWDPKDRICASPMPIWRITGRMPERTVTPRGAPLPAPESAAKPQAAAR